MHGKKGEKKKRTIHSANEPAGQPASYMSAAEQPNSKP